ncbi:hypothetical protein HYT52_03980 [Candidatus Woesearchaeota archaeon]|nr:hypothetical protein [Candidatus Woesearchaeota archaeon]
MSVKRKLLYLIIFVGSLMAGCAAKGKMKIEKLNETFPKDKQAVVEVVKDVQKQKELAADAVLIQKALDNYNRKSEIFWKGGEGNVTLATTGWGCPGKLGGLRNFLNPDTRNRMAFFPFAMEEYLHAEKILLELIDQLDREGFSAKAKELRKLIGNERDKELSFVHAVRTNMLVQIKRQGEMTPENFSAVYKLNKHLIELLFKYGHITTKQKNEALAEELASYHHFGSEGSFEGLSFEECIQSCDFTIPLLYP